MREMSLEGRFFDLKKYLEAKRTKVEAELERLVDGLPKEERVVSALRHSLMSGGKRLRPILCIAAAEAVSRDRSCMDDVLLAGCSLEMIHTYSLIHDDLPAMDDDDLRRGKPTCHVAFDEATAILAGDALLTLAFEVMSSRAGDPEADHCRWLRVVNLVSRAAGACGMVGGQMADMSAEGTKLSLEALREMHSRKTGALIRASVSAGAILAGASRSRLERLEKYAADIGLAFQVADDILDVEGDPALMGKAAGVDAKREKNTYPSLMGPEGARRFARELVGEALNALSSFDERSEPLRAIARYIVERKR